MKKNLDFTYVTSGLEVSFRVLTKVPAKSIFDWDFGDDKGGKDERENEIREGTVSLFPRLRRNL